jgi:hypothetical protein
MLLLIVKLSDIYSVYRLFYILMTSQHGTQSAKTHARTTQTTKEMGNTDTTKKRGEIRCSRKNKQLLLLIRHSPFYSYLQSSPVIVMAVIKERRHLREIQK